MMRRTSPGTVSGIGPAISYTRRRSASVYPSSPTIERITADVALLGEEIARQPGHHGEFRVEGVDAVHEEEKVLGHVPGHVQGVVHFAPRQRRHALAHQAERVLVF